MYRTSVGMMFPNVNMDANAAYKTLEKMSISPGEQCVVRNTLADKQRIVNPNRLSIEKLKRIARLVGPQK